MQGIIPIVFVPFTETGEVDDAGLRAVVRFELEGGADGIGVGGFASEAYKLTDAERFRTASIVAEEVAGRVPLVIGLAAGSSEAAVAQTRELRHLEPAAFMVLPPATMTYAPQSLVEHYLRLADASPAPLMVQHSPHIPQYGHVALEVAHLAAMASGSGNIAAFKIEGPGAPERMRALQGLIPAAVKLFGGVGGISFLEELEVGVAGVIPGVGFNEVFHEAWAAWGAGDRARVRETLTRHQPLVEAVSGKGHEFSLHARKRLAQRAGLISSARVRHPSVAPSPAEIETVLKAADAFDLRINRRITA